MLGKSGNTAAAIAMLCLGLAGPASAVLINPDNPDALEDRVSMASHAVGAKSKTLANRGRYGRMINGCG